MEAVITEPESEEEAANCKMVGMVEALPLTAGPCLPWEMMWAVDILAAVLEADMGNPMVEQVQIL